MAPFSVGIVIEPSHAFVVSHAAPLLCHPEPAEGKEGRAVDVCVSGVVCALVVSQVIHFLWHVILFLARFYLNYKDEKQTLKL